MISSTPKFIFIFITALMAILIVKTYSSKTETTALADSESVNNISVTDYQNNIIKLASPAQRIIALAPNIVENVFSAGAGNKLVGVVSYSNFPEQAKSITQVGDFNIINYEKIVELNPDLIIAWGTGNKISSIQQLKKLGFKVYVDEPKSLHDIAKSIRDIGLLANTKTVADKQADDFLDNLAKHKNNSANKRVISAFYQVWNEPLQTVNGEHLISHAIALCGGKNIYADQPSIAPIINIESILERNPEVIIASGATGKRPIWLDDWKRWNTLSAVQNNNLFFVAPGHIQRHTRRILFGINRICADLEQVRSKG